MTSLIILLVQRGKPLQTGLVLGFAVHFKIYPIIYTPTILLALDSQYDALIFPRTEPKAYGPHQPKTYTGLLRILNKSRIVFIIGSAIGFVASTYWMYNLYGQDFIHHTYLHHFSRLDHRHNFSPYHLTLYLSSALPRQVVSIPSLAFVPQLVIVGVVVPLALIGKDLATTMFAQTFAFVAFNKVCTSQVSLSPLSLPCCGPDYSISCGISRFCHFISLLPHFFSLVGRASLLLQRGYYLRLFPRESFFEN